MANNFEIEGPLDDKFFVPDEESDRDISIFEVALAALWKVDEGGEISEEGDEVNQLKLKLNPFHRDPNPGTGKRIDWSVGKPLLEEDADGGSPGGWVRGPDGEDDDEGGEREKVPVGR